jgi:hypothetical protein
VENAFRATRFFSDIVVAPNLDAALESCENAIIEARTKRTTARPAPCANGLPKRSAVRRMLTS